MVADLKTLLSVILLPFAVVAFFVRGILSIIRSVFKGAILGCLAPLGLLALMVVAAMALVIF